MKYVITGIHKFVVGTLLLIGLLTLGSAPAFCQKAETI